VKPVRELLFFVVTFSPYGLFCCWSLLVRSRPTTVVVTPTPTEIVPYKIPSGIVDYVLANRYTGEGHPGEHLLYLSQLCSLFKLVGVTMEFVMKKLFSISLKDKASDWYKLLDNSDLLEWPELMSLFYAKFYPLREIHQDRNYIYNFWSRDGESIAQAWGRLKSLMLKCPNHELPKEIILTIFYARLSR
jgi:Retrotransposon gag protein